MSEPRPLARPPVVEALVDVRVTFAAEPPVERFRAIGNALRDGYPVADERRSMRAEFRVEAGKLIAPETEDLGFEGLFLRAADGTRVAQFRKDGFTFNQLPPYSSGERLLDEALRLWRVFAQSLEPVSVERIALRYINRLNLPFQGGDEFRRFLTNPPELPQPAPQLVSEFLSRIVAFEPTKKSTVVVVQKLEAGIVGSPTVVTIDIDAFSQVSLEPSSDLRPGFESLRELKNHTFFALLTDAALESYL